MYRGSVRLSFWSDSASSTAAIPTTAKYRKLYRVCLVRKTFDTNRQSPTEKGSAHPARRSTRAAAYTTATNARLPSTVFEVVGDHRCTPTRRPTIDACHNFQSEIETQRKLTAYRRVAKTQGQDTRKLQQLTWPGKGTPVSKID